MKILTIRKNLLIAILVSTFIIIIGTIFLNIMVKNQHSVISTDIDKFKEPYMSSFWASSNVNNYVEIFDVEKGKVIKKVQINEIILEEAQKHLQGIVGIYTKVKALPDKGYIIKIPFGTNVIVNNPLLNDYEINTIDKYFIILPEQNAPYLLVLDDRGRPFFYYFKGEIGKLLKSINFEIDYPK